jgi:hypothetical protein
MRRRISVLTARHRVMALVATLGAGTAMFAAGPSTQAHASVRTAPAARTAAHTVHFTVHAHAATTGRIGSFANPLDITCNFDVGSPFDEGPSGNSVVYASTSTQCVYDSDGSPATVSSIALSEDLLLNNAIVAHNPRTIPNTSNAQASVGYGPCRGGDYTNRVSLLVTFPPGYDPQQESAAGFSTTTIAACPGDQRSVPDVLGMSQSQASAALASAGLATGHISYASSCDYAPAQVMATDPHPGASVVVGAVVDLTISTGPLASRPCP